MTATKLKTYTVQSCDAFASADVVKALGLPRHIRQCRVLVVAKSKTSAAEVTRFTTREFRLATGVDVDVLGLAGELDYPRVLWQPLDGFGPVVEQTSGGALEVGQIRRLTDGTYRFEPAVCRSQP